jgi:hypothetical protein
MLTGAVLMLLALPTVWLVVTDLRKWLGRESSRRRLTEEMRMQQNRRLRLVLGGSVRRPGPYAKLPGREIA